MAGFLRPISGGSHSLISPEAPGQLIHHRSTAGLWRATVYSVIPSGASWLHSVLLLPDSKLQSEITTVIKKKKPCAAYFQSLTARCKDNLLVNHG